MKDKIWQLKADVQFYMKQLDASGQWTIDSLIDSFSSFS